MKPLTSVKIIALLRAVRTRTCPLCKQVQNAPPKHVINRVRVCKHCYEGNLMSEFISVERFADMVSAYHGNARALLQRILDVENGAYECPHSAVMYRITYDGLLRYECLDILVAELDLEESSDLAASGWFDYPTLENLL